MLVLPQFLKSRALFQSEARLNIAGSASPNTEVTVEIRRGNTVFTKNSAAADDNGTFAVEIANTPAPSFDEYSVTVSAGEDSFTAEEIMFGELWLGSGQSNLEFSNSSETDSALLYEKIKGKNIRVLYVSYPSTNMFPWEPDRTRECTWSDADMPRSLDGISAVGLKFISEIYDFLNRAGDVPVGLLNASWGGTSMPCWLPKDAIDEDEFISSKLKEYGQYPTAENWNSRGDLNFQQTSCQYNVKIAPLEGLKVRGVLWYQGENETGGAFHQKIYAEYLRFYHKVYAERFAADPEHFMMISSLIYPWTYGPSGECSVGYINDAFIETAVNEPDKFAAAPICDLAPRWAFHQGNHPIHPANKYPLGERLASLALDSVYDRGWEQKIPAHLSSWEVCGSKIKLTFASTGFGLFVDNDFSALNRPIGLYVAGEDNVYLPAECEIDEDGEQNVMYVWCDEIPEPKNAAYAIQSLEPRCNLWAGIYPVYSFHTDTVNKISIEARPWYDTHRTSVWASQLRGDILDLFYHPIWQPCSSSEVCTDTAFTLEGQSVRVCAADYDSRSFGCYVKSYPYNRLDLEKFTAVSADFYNNDGLCAKLVIEWDGGFAELPFEKVCDLRGGWSRYRAPIASIPEGADIRKMKFSFTKPDGIAFVNLEKVRLLK